MKPLITILGSTACGKTALAVALARTIGGEILSADSRQVYQGMDIGTGKDRAEYGAVPYHLIDICAAGEKYNLFRYHSDFRRALAAVQQREAYPILCGGTGLYIESILKGYALPAAPQNAALRAALAGQPLAALTAYLAALKAQHGTQMHNTTDVDTPQRAIRAIEIELARDAYAAPTAALSAATPTIDESALVRGRDCVFGVALSREERRQKITQRLRARLEEGMIDEVRRLLSSGIAAEDLIYYGLEYKYVTEYCLGQRSYDDMFCHLEIAIHQFAKRQMTWFRGMERRGITIHWLAAEDSTEEKIGEIVALLREKST